MERSDYLNIKYIDSIFTAEEFDKKKKRFLNLPQIAIAGYSNVGKSSLINAMNNGRKVAYVAKQAGKTRSINFYDSGENFLIVDLPGYGFAKVSKKEKEKWSILIDKYFQEFFNIKLVLIVVDARRGLRQLDVKMVDFCKKVNLNHLVVFNKIDKLKKSELGLLKKKNYKLISAQTKDGIKQLVKSIRNIVKLA